VLRTDGPALISAFCVECGVSNTECGMWGVECRVSSVECGVWSVECGVSSVECRVWSVECGVCDRSTNDDDHN